jgi:multidrug efflux pump subunit AcrB
MASLGLSLEDLRGVIVNATTVSPTGTIDGKTRTFTIYDNSQMLNAAPWNDVIVAYKNGAPVRIRDIGRAIDAPENIRLAAFANGKPAILLPVYKLPGANVIQTVDSIKPVSAGYRARPAIAGTASNCSATNWRMSSSSALAA